VVLRTRYFQQQQRGERQQCDDEPRGVLVLRELPEQRLREAATLAFDVARHRLREAAWTVLRKAGIDHRGLAGASRRDRARRERALTECVANDAEFLDAYEGLVREVVARELGRSFAYQFPPTLRVQPPCRGAGFCHSDADFGHQAGERNYWLPLTDFSSTRTALLVESKPGHGDFAPLALDYGFVAAFHGAVCRHFAPPNPGPFFRVSLDFRAAILADDDDIDSSALVFAGPLASHSRTFLFPSSSSSSSREAVAR